MSKVIWGAARLAVVCILAAGALGCFKYRETINLQRNGSGTVEIEATIPESVAKGYRAEDAEQVPPVSAGYISSKLFLGSDRVDVTTSTVELRDDQWYFHVVASFKSLQDLNRVRFFRDRAMRLDPEANNKMRFAEVLKPDLIKMAKDESSRVADNPYVAYFLAVLESTTDWKTKMGTAELTYEVVMPGATASAPSGRVEGLPEERVKATWNFTLIDVLNAQTPPGIAMVIDLPAEKGPMTLIIVLLLASMVGIVVPAIRLLMLKSKGMG